MEKLKNFFSINKLLYLLVFTSSFSFFLILQLKINFFLGSDAYYHATHSQLTFLSSTIHYVEPWIKLHFFTSAPVNPYFIFHWIGGFFISIFGKVFGFKIFTSLLSASVVTSFYFILKKNKVSHALLWTVLLFTSAFLIFRLLLPRSFIFSITLLLLGYYLIDQKKYLLLFLLSIFYTLYYSFFVFLLVLAISYFISSIIEKNNLEIKPALTVVAGIFVGLLLHPNTINYIQYLYHQTIEVFFLKITLAHFPTGEEIGTHSSIIKFLGLNLFPITSFLAASVVTWYLVFEKKIKHTRKLLPLLVFNSFWLILFFIIPRSGEYFIPFTWLHLAISCKLIKSEDINFSQIKKLINTKINYITKLVAVCIITLTVVIGVKLNLQTIDKHNRKITTELNHFQEVANYLETNTPKNSTLFLSNWSQFPKLFFYNQHNKYLTGFSPLFAYNYNKEKYWTWYNLANFGYSCSSQPPCLSNPKDIKQAFTKTLNTKYILINEKSDNNLLKTRLRLQKDKYEEKLNNNNFILYEVK